MTPLRFSASTEPTIDDAQMLADAKLYLRVTGHDADGEIHRMMHAAIRNFQKRASRQVLTRTLVLNLDCFPLRSWIDIPRPPLQSITSITYTDGDDAGQTWAATEYDVLTEIEPGRVRLAHDKSYPTNAPRDIVITYVAGYGTTWSSIPHDVQDCLLHVLSHKYYQRDGAPELEGITHSINALHPGSEFTW